MKGSEYLAVGIFAVCAIGAGIFFCVLIFMLPFQSFARGDDGAGILQLAFAAWVAGVLLCILRGAIIERTKKPAP